jgi:RNA polymerase sigma-70 factor (ECF subfamily)
VLSRQFPALAFDESEDMVQEAFAVALQHWSKTGVPENPTGWLFKVARNKAVDLLKAKNKFFDKVDEHELSETHDYDPKARLKDLNLQILAACAHPDLSPKTQTILTLKYVMNLKVEAIARAFAMTIDGVDKTLFRARERIRTRGIRFAFEGRIEDRLPVMHRMIYLIFNEGYKASYGRELIREELCEEALLLCRELLEAGAGNADSNALYALMLFNSARFKSRFGDNDEIIDLENQNRRLWNQELIEMASYYLERSRTDQISTFHIEASIACLHCRARRFEDTDWQLISKLYERF